MENLTRLREEFDLIDARCRIAQRRADVSDSKEAKIQIEELELRIRTIRIEYGRINIARHPNVVLSDLALLQGQEIDALDQLRMWKEAKKVNLMLATELEICENKIKRIQENEK